MLRPMTRPRRWLRDLFAFLSCPDCEHIQNAIAREREREDQVRTRQVWRMSRYGCYQMGPTLGPTERPWPITWESDPYRDELGGECSCTEWELVMLAADGQHRARFEEVVRCRECHAPRCGHSMDEDPCILRRHHSGAHETCSEWERSLRRSADRCLPIIAKWKREQSASAS